jgi:hypothetical protein
MENQKNQPKGGFEMKRKSFMGAVVLGALLVVFAGISQAGGVMHRSSGDERAAIKTTSQEFSFAEFGEGGPPMEYWEALGTGSKSSGDERPAVKTTSQEFSFAESGEGGPSLEYWEALGTGSVSSSEASSRLLDTGVDPSRWEGPTQ